MSYNKKTPIPEILDSSPFKSAYSPKLKVSLTFPENSPYTKQEFKDECDINTIMSRYQETGELPPLNQVAPQYLDLSAGIDFQSSMEYVAQAQTLFNELPSAIRSRFHNNPAEFLEFTSNPDNHAQMGEMGLLRPEAVWSIPEQPPLPFSPPEGTPGALNINSSTPPSSP